MRISDWSSDVCSSDLIDLEDGAVELAAFSLCLSLCDALQPEEIRSSVQLFPPLADVTLHHSCFFDAKANGLITAPVAVIVGNPPFESSLTNDGAKRRSDERRVGKGGGIRWSYGGSR